LTRREDSLDLVVFDIDDTLYLEREYVFSGLRAVGEHARRLLGVPDLGDRALALFLDGRRGDLFDRALASLGMDPNSAVVEELVAVYRAHEPVIAMTEDAMAAVSRLRNTTRLACLTDGPIESQRAKARVLGLAALVSSVVFTADLGDGYGKPHPRAFEQLERRFGTGGGRVAYVADNPSKDFTAPHALGWRTVRVRRPLSLHVLADSGDDVDAELVDMDDLESVLGCG
jgi:putative hydrolase of the HAD superfamily